jgi:hypothetical protein
MRTGEVDRRSRRSSRERTDLLLKLIIPYCLTRSSVLARRRCSDFLGVVSRIVLAPRWCCRRRCRCCRLSVHCSRDSGSLDSSDRSTFPASALTGDWSACCSQTRDSRWRPARQSTAMTKLPRALWTGGPRTPSLRSRAVLFCPPNPLIRSVSCPPTTSSGTRLALKSSSMEKRRRSRPSPTSSVSASPTHPRLFVARTSTDEPECRSLPAEEL